MNICPKCLNKNSPCANWCESCGELLLPDNDRRPERPRPVFREYWYEPTSGKAKFIRFISTLVLLGGLVWSWIIGKEALFADKGVNYDGILDQLLIMLPDIGLVCASVFLTITVYIALRSFAEMVQNSTANRSMNEFMMRKLEKLEDRQQA